MAGRDWIDPFEGFEFDNDTVTVEASHQAEKLLACGLDPALFGDQVDPAFFIGIAIHAGIDSGITAEGNINMLQSLVQHRPVMVGEPLTVKGRITRVTQVPRGRTIDTDCWLEGEDGHRAISAPRRSLKPDPDKREQKGAGERPPPVIAGTPFAWPRARRWPRRRVSTRHPEKSRTTPAGFLRPGP